MIESYITSFISTFIQCASSASLCFFVVRDILNKRPTVIFTETVVFVTLYSLTYTLYGSYNTVEMVLYVVCISCGWWFLKTTTRENSVWLFFLACMVFSFIHFCAAVSFVIYTLWMPQYSHGPYVYEDIVVFSLPIVIFWGPFAYEMRHLYIRLRELVIPNMWRLCAIPLLFTICLWLQSVFLSGDTIGEVESCIVKGFIIVSAFLTYSQMISALTSAEKVIREEERLKFLSQQLELQRHRMEDMESHAEELRRIRHDRRQHMAVLKTFLSDGDIKKAREYLQDYENSISENIQPPLCDNFAADAICRRYEILAKQADIKTELSLSLPQAPGISSSDLAVILGNLWENAIAAALDSPHEKFIRLQIAEKEDKLLIRMENSFSGNVKEVDGKYLSTKAGRNQTMGIGLSSIKTTAERNGGIAEFLHEGTVFTASVLLFEGE